MGEAAMILTDREFAGVVAALQYMRSIGPTQAGALAWTDDKAVYTLATDGHSFPPLTDGEVEVLLSRLLEAEDAEITKGDAPAELTDVEQRYVTGRTAAVKRRKSRAKV